MTVVVYCAIYLGALVFLIASATRAIACARAPMHLRWELYPVPHEKPERVRHGGSYYEDGAWRDEPRGFNLAGDVRFMVPEMIFLKGLWEWNRRLWYRSFPFHFGLYLVVAATVLVVATALGRLAMPVLMDGTTGRVLRTLYRVAGTGGAILAFCGAAGLLHRRLTDPALKIYSAPADVFNLAFFLAVIGVLAGGYLTAGAQFPGAVVFTRALLTLDTSVHVPGLLGAGLVLAAALVAYIPLTHMSHFIVKYFTYHAVRWDDRPNIAGGKLEHRIAACLALRPTWSASHIAGDGAKTWRDIAFADPTRGGKK